ncbi:MAG: AsmA family protein [Pseudomonadales bacterium]
MKIVLGLVALAVLLFVALIIAVTVIIEPNDYRPYIVDAVQNSTGRSFEVQGDLGLELLPCCSVSLGRSRLGSPAGFPDDFASLDSAALSIKIWPLISRRVVEIGTVTLSGVSLDLQRLADGRVNWEFESAAPDTPADPAAPATPIGLSVERLVLRDGQVRYRDQEAAQDYTVSALQLDTRLAMSGDRMTVSRPVISLVAGGDGLPEPVTVDMQAGSLIATLDDAASVAVEGLELDLRTLDSRLRVRGGGRAGSELDLAGDFTLDETSPRELMRALGDDAFVPADDGALRRLAASGRWTVTGSSANLDDVDIRLDDSHLTGSAAVTDFERSAVTFDLALDRIDVDRYAAAAQPAAAPAGAGEPTLLPLGALAGVPVNGKLSVGTLRSAGIDVSDLALTLTSAAGVVATSLDARALNGSLKIDGRGDVRGAEPALAGTIAVSDVSPRALLEAADAVPETADANVLRRFAGTARWQLTPKAVAFEDMRWQLDDTTFTGSARVEDFDSLAPRFDIVLDRMNVDAYLPPESDAPAESDPDAEIIPVALIRDLDARGRLRAGELTILKMTLRDVVAQVNAANGIMRLDPLSAALYGGTYKGTVTIDATGPKAALTLDQELAAVQVTDLLNTLFATDLLGGSLSFKLAGAGRGNTTTELLRGLAADVSMDLSDGVYRGTDVLYQVRRARALLKNEAAPEAPAQMVTPIRALKAAGRMVDGVLQTNQLSADTDALRLLGAGGINLIDLTLDYDLEAQVLSAGAQAAKLGDLANATIPLTLSGPLMAPKVAVDMKGLVTSAVRETVQQKARETLLKKLGGDEPEAGGAGSTPADPAAPAADPPSTKDLLKRGLRDLLKPKEPEPETPPG